MFGNIMYTIASQAWSPSQLSLAFLLKCRGSGAVAFAILFACLSSRRTVCIGFFLEEVMAWIIPMFAAAI